MAEEGGEENLSTLAESIVALDEQSAVSVICSVLQNRPELAPSVVSYAVPELTYPPIKALVERRSEGYIKSFNGEKGFGFIACEELSKVFGNDVFIVGQQMQDFQVGDEVSFAVALNKDNKPQAYDMRHLWSNGWKGASGPSKGPSKGNSGKGGGKGSYDYAPAATVPRATVPQWSPPIKGAGKGKAKSYSASSTPAKRTHDGEFKVDAEKILGDYVGFIKSFNDATGYGFIACEDLKMEGYNDVFLHKAPMLASGLDVGDEAEFTCFLNPRNQPQAMDLRPVSKGTGKGK